LVFEDSLIKITSAVGGGKEKGRWRQRKITHHCLYSLLASSAMFAHAPCAKKNKFNCAWQCLYRVYRISQQSKSATARLRMQIKKNHAGHCQWFFTGSEKTTPPINLGKEPLWYRVP
jgi:hypothetical protein